MHIAYVSSAAERISWLGELHENKIPAQFTTVTV